MTKADLVEKVTGAGDLTRRDGEVIVETIFDAVIGALKSGERVEVPAKKVPYFKPSKELRDLVNPREAASAA